MALIAHTQQQQTHRQLGLDGPVYHLEDVRRLQRTEARRERQKRGRGGEDEPHGSAMSLTEHLPP